ncbi:MAG TPA: STAS domain-containing protein [bacterium]|nr:STAS domain-containing protein [bacterium]
MHGGLAHVAIRPGDGIPVLEVAGIVDMTSVALLDTALQDAAALERGGVIVVLDQATYFDSEGLELLFRRQASLATRRPTLRVVMRRAHPLRRLFDIVGSAAIIPVFDTLEEACGEQNPRASEGP